MTEALVEEDLGAVEAELQTELLIVDSLISTKVEERLFKVFVRIVVSPKKEI